MYIHSILFNTPRDIAYREPEHPGVELCREIAHSPCSKDLHLDEDAARRIIAGWVQKAQACPDYIGWNEQCEEARIREAEKTPQGQIFSCLACREAQSDESTAVGDYDTLVRTARIILRAHRLCCIPRFGTMFCEEHDTEEGWRLVSNYWEGLLRRPRAIGGLRFRRRVYAADTTQHPLRQLSTQAGSARRK